MQTEKIFVNNPHIKELEKRIEDQKLQMPKHSIPLAMIIELEDLEDELEDAQKVINSVDDSDA